MQQQLVIEVHSEGNRHIVVPRGEIDLATNGQLRTAVNDLVVDGKVHLVIDMTEVTFLDSTGLGVLIGARRKANAFNGSFAIVCNKEHLLKIFRITGLDNVFEIHPTREAALAAIAD